MEANFVLLFILLLTLFLSFTSSYEIRAIDKLQSVQRLPLRSAVGAESLAFDRSGQGPYTGVSNGRILKWEENTHHWTLFAFNSNHRYITISSMVLVI